MEAFIPPRTCGARRVWSWSGDGSRQDEGRPRVGEEDQRAMKLPSPINPFPPDASAVLDFGIWLQSTLHSSGQPQRWLSMLLTITCSLLCFSFHWLNLSQVLTENRNMDQVSSCPLGATGTEGAGQPSGMGWCAGKEGGVTLTGS